MSTVVKLLLSGVLCRFTTRPSSGDPRFLRGFRVVPTTVLGFGGVKRRVKTLLPLLWFLRESQKISNAA